MRQFDELQTGRRARLEPVPYTEEDGLRSIECQIVGQPSAWRDPAGNLWFPTVRGVVRIRPQAKPRLPPPKVVVEGVESSSQSHVIRFSAPRLSAPGRLEFRYRVETTDPGWIQAGADRTIRYGRLSAGSHLVSIAARETGGEWGQGTTVALMQAPQQHETWWFRLVVIAAAGSLLWGVYRWRVHLLKGRYAAVMAERNRIAGEWHDTLLAGFSAISWQLEAALKQLREKPQAAAETLGVARTMVQHYRGEARRVIWDLRREQAERESLAAAISRVLGEMTRGRGIEASVVVDGAAEALPGELSQDLLRICQEAAGNAIRHGAPSRIEVRLRFDSRQVLATIRDDGSGFQPERVPVGHFGLDIMRERVKRHGGEMQIDSPEGGGTIITAAIPYLGAS